ncbi:hypothetical protein FP2506_12189 [Fulvimarina pelagi HTCC2506]|uniref:Periplasmic lipoprotein n=2 Tax=Fulvimarina pelagi TaxID=217511 RepID=Q0G1Q8_9HYPH|nr:DUF2291 domain-containing protein [Fulvimarina pelagi]EAU41023.1 hypothetical protein FP2506_12189 [Fulvimarina pelagi HTCC2506]BAT30958.1 hypothetical protein [Fulvimarina pelagi]
MSLQSTSRSKNGGNFFSARILLPAAGAILLVAMALDTTIVWEGSEEAASFASDTFSPEEFGAAQFPDIQTFVETRAVEAETLANEIAADKAAASEKYGVSAGVGAVMPVKFSGVVGDGRSGVYDVNVEGLPEETRVRVQTGPAVNGTDLRDAMGTIEFGQFKNQIEYQNAGAAINDVMKAEVLQPIDNSELTGKTITVTGVFKLINPKNWLVTPVRMSVEQ